MPQHKVMVFAASAACFVIGLMLIAWLGIRMQRRRNDITVWLSRKVGSREGWSREAALPQRYTAVFRELILVGHSGSRLSYRVIAALIGDTCERPILAVVAPESSARKADVDRLVFFRPHERVDCGQHPAVAVRRRPLSHMPVADGVQLFYSGIGEQPWYLYGIPDTPSMTACIHLVKQLESESLDSGHVRILAVSRKDVVLIGPKLSLFKPETVVPFIDSCERVDRLLAATLGRQE